MDSLDGNRAGGMTGGPMGEDKMRGALATKTCPRCGAELYADMNVCYDCLYDFSRDSSRRSLSALPTITESPRDDATDPSAAPAAGAGRERAVGVLLRTASLDCWVGVPSEGASVGRDPDNDVVLHSPAVSDHHLRLVPTPDGMEVHDLGSANPARFRGRDVRGLVIAPYGDSVEVCGCVLTMTGPPGGPQAEEVLLAP